MSIFKNLTRILLSGAVLFCLWGCGDDVSHYTETYEHKIPMGGDSVLSYKAFSSYRTVSSTNSSQFGSQENSTTTRIGMSIDFCVLEGGIEKSCIKSIPYSTLADKPLMSTFAKGVYLLDFLDNPSRPEYPNLIQKIWNWETGVYSVDTLPQKDSLIHIKSTFPPTSSYTLLTVALSDEGYFLRFTDSYSSEDVYATVDLQSKRILKAKMDTATVYNNRSNLTYLGVKCKLGQWAYKGNRYCGVENATYTNWKTRVFVNDSLKMGCDGAGGGFFRLYNNKNSLNEKNMRTLTGWTYDNGREVYLFGDDCK